jgi:hypothetical protein
MWISDFGAEKPESGVTEWHIHSAIRIPKFLFRE